MTTHQLRHPAFDAASRVAAPPAVLNKAVTWHALALVCANPFFEITA